MKKIIQLFILLSLSGYSQNTIKGTVSNIYKQPLQNVIIHLNENNTTVETNKLGQFELVNVPNGRVTIELYLLGFETKKISHQINASNTEVNIVLEEKHNALNEVIVSTAFKKALSKNVMKVASESLKNLQEKGATSLIEGLATIPGVSQISTGTSIGKPVIRGLSSNRVLVYVQGVRLENQQFGGEHGLGISASGIESVEVIKGPASLLYGSDALGGVIYFNPENYALSNTSQGNFYQQFLSNTQGTNTTFGYKSSPNNWKFLVNANYNSQLDYKISNGEKVINTRFIEKDLKYGIGYGNSAFSTDFRYNYNNLNLGLPEENLVNEGNRTPLFPSQDIDNHILSLSQKIYFENSKLEADFGYIFNNRKELEALDEVALYMKLKTANYNVKYYLPKMKQLETIIGIQGINQVNANFGEELLIPNAILNDFGGFITSNLELEKSVFQAGIRFDSRRISTQEHGVVGDQGYMEAVKKEFNSLNFALGYKTDLTTKTDIRINLATGFRAPNLSELTSNGVHEGSNRYEIGNSNLKNEQNLQADLNVEYKSEHFEFFVNGFYNYISNYIYLNPTGAIIDNADVYNYTQNNASLFGGEAGIHFHPHPLDWLHVTSSIENVNAKQTNGQNLPLIPANQLKNNFKANFNINNWFTYNYASIQVNHTFLQNKVSQFETLTKDYTLINLAIGSKININKIIFNANINANNVLNKNYFSHLSRLKTDGIANIGRNIMLSVGFNF